MPDSLPIPSESELNFCRTEIDNFLDIFRHVMPNAGEIPCLPGMDIYGQLLPLNGVSGGDHLIYIDFNRRYDMEAGIREAGAAGRAAVAEKLRLMKNRAGFLLADVSGHQTTDALMAAMLHQAFLTGVQYELRHHGEITAELFETINTRFYNSSSQFKFITMLYGEISANGTFRFLSAAHPPPLVFSNLYDRFVPIGSEQMTHFPPVGTLPSRNNLEARGLRKPERFKDDYEVSQIDLMGRGDILLLYTDGLSDHQRGEGEYYFPQRLERTLAAGKALPARDLAERIRLDMLDFGPPGDDVSLVIIKKTT